MKRVIYFIGCVLLTSSFLACEKEIIQPTHQVVSPNNDSNLKSMREGNSIRNRDSVVVVNPDSGGITDPNNDEYNKKPSSKN